MNEGRGLSEAYQRALVEACPVALLSLDFDGRVLTWNDAATRMFGWKRDEAIGTMLPIVPEHAADESAALRARVARGEAFTGVELRRRCKDGTEIDISLSAAPIRDSDESVIGIMAAIENITEHRAAVAALRRNERLLTQAEEVAELGSWEFDLETDTVWWSKEMYRLFGVDPAAPAPRFGDYEKMFAPDDMQRLRAAIATARDTGEPYELELRAFRADGTTFWGVARGRVETDDRGPIKRLYGSLQNISARKAEETERTRLLRAIEQVREAIVITDADGTIEYVNSGFERVTGYTRSEVCGRNPRILKSGEHDAAFYEPMWAALAEGETWQGRLINRRKDGSLYTEDMTISPVVDPSGNVVNYVAVKRDVTRELNLEHELAKSQRLEAIGRLAGGLAHDFNNMLTVILGNTNLALEEVDTESPLYLDLEEIRAAAERSTTMIDQLLAVARKQVVTPHVFDLNNAILARIEMLRRLIGEDIALDVRPTADIPPVLMDPGQLDRVLTNLVANARNAIVDVGKVTIETDSVRFDEAYCADHPGFQPGEYVVLTISDTGVGIDSDVMSTIFEPFVTTSRTGKGTGLGLAMVHGIVKQNRGFIHVYSEPGEGATLRIYLPPASAEAEERVLEADDAALPTGSGTVLLVEDESALLHLASRFLRTLGYSVLPAGSPAEALQVAREHTGDIDLLITDVVMPEMNGRQLAEELTALWPEVPCLYMSGYTADIIARRSVLEDDVRFLQKPFSLRDLAVAVEEALRG